MAQDKPGENVNTRILFVFDGSRSMQGRWESGKKIDIAQRLMTNILDSLQSLESGRFELALRIYGHQSPVPPQNCDDTRLEVPFSKNNIADIKREIRGISPKGTTPIARSIRLSGEDFPPCADCRNIIILITDGVEACDEDPCATSRILQKKGITLKPFIIGVGIEEEDKDNLDCMGNYYDASDEQTFENVLRVVISQALNNTTAQVSLLDENGKPTETNVPITFYNKVSGKANLQLMHTLNRNGVPDTIYLDPLVNYRMTVHSIPEKHLDTMVVYTGKHNTIKLPLERGALEVTSRSLSRFPAPYFLVYRPGSNEALNVQEFETKSHYLTGNYEIEILTLPRIHRKVKIKANETTRIELETPGVLNVQASAAGYGTVLERKQDGREKWVTNLRGKNGRYSLLLQPGDYTLVFRSKSSHNSSFSKVKNFTINSGEHTILKMN